MRTSIFTFIIALLTLAACHGGEGSHNAVPADIIPDDSVFVLGTWERTVSINDSVDTVGGFELYEDGSARSFNLNSTVESWRVNNIGDTLYLTLSIPTEEETRTVEQAYVVRLVGNDTLSLTSQGKEAVKYARKR
ncbi:MAG: hypothetical protein IK092_04230 [Muribaculaceae bacterium]|nr:hypothetical protein [Muribaculaceae bacterium]